MTKWIILSILTIIIVLAFILWKKRKKEKALKDKGSKPSDHIYPFY
tara:strand:+ start:1500 stop:1637 length:138 start_codon:yes stop_codon:yes gene_type:complete